MEALRGMKMALLALAVVCAMVGASAAAEPGAEANGWAKCPVSFSIDYTVVSDYVWRGANLSEYAGEGREKLNHQLGTDIGVDLDEFGTVGFRTWFEWFAGQSSLTPRDNSNLQEVDYGLYWQYEIPQAGLTTELGWVAYQFPPLGGDGHSSYEVYGSIGFNDGLLFGTDEGVLNPTVAYYHDYDLVKAGWLEIGVSHEFAGPASCPLMKNMTITPSLTLTVDHRYWDRATDSCGVGTRLGSLLYGVEMCYDLGAAIEMPEQAGSLTVTGFLNFSQALHDQLLSDEFYGGVKLSYATK